MKILKYENMKINEIDILLFVVNNHQKLFIWDLKCWYFWCRYQFKVSHCQINFIVLDFGYYLLND